MLRKFNSLEELQNDKTLQSMGRYGWEMVELKGEKVYACTTNQQYEDIIYGGTYGVLKELFDHFGLQHETQNLSITDLSTEVREFILDKLERKGIRFVDVYEEY